MSVEIRKVLESDVKSFRSALDSVVSERKYLATTVTPSLESVTEFNRSIVENNYAQYVALLESEIIGWADVIPYEKELMRHVGLLGIGVVSMHRGKGIGKKLLSHVIDHSREIGLKRIELEVFAYNTNAIALYKQFGFELEGVKRKARYINGSYVDVCIMGVCDF